jgi:hypothetical protein
LDVKPTDVSSQNVKNNQDAAWRQFIEMLVLEYKAKPNYMGYMSCRLVLRLGPLRRPMGNWMGITSVGVCKSNRVVELRSLGVGALILM